MTCIEDELSDLRRSCEAQVQYSKVRKRETKGTTRGEENKEGGKVWISGNSGYDSELPNPTCNSKTVKYNTKRSVFS